MIKSFWLFALFWLFTSAASALTLTSISPNSGIATGGNTVTITGTDLANVNSVDFSGYLATIQSQNSTQVIVTVPDGQMWGAVDVQVDDNNSSAFRSGWYTYLTPVIDSVSPSQGPVGGGTSVTITGTNFTNDVADVYFNGASVTSFSWINSTTISAITPDSTGSVGLVSVDIDTSAGTAYGANLFTYLAPTISSVLPAQGPEAGGISVTITGSGFSGITDVQFNYTSATSFIVVDSNTITAVTPDSSGATGLVPISIDTTSNSYSFPNAYTYLAPIISGVAPNQGPVSGGTSVTISGSNFSAITDVQFNYISATSFTIVDSNTITAVTPGTGNTTALVSVSIDTTSNSYNFANQFTYIAAPVISLISPASGDTYGGIPVTITGSNFVIGAAVTINSIPLTGLIITATSITGITPALPIGVYNIVVTNPDGQSSTVSNGFTVNQAAAPTIGNIVPGVGETSGGLTVSISGSNFVVGTTATINGVALTGLNIVNATTITANTPSLPTGVYDLVVTNPDGQIATLNNAFTVILPQQFMAGDLAPRGSPDGAINVGDLVVLSRFIYNFETPTQREFLAADIAPLSAPDSVLNVADFLMLQRAILGQVTLANVADNTAPNISIISPVNNSYTTASSVTVSGILDEQATLTINGTVVTLDSFLTFTQSINLQEGSNTITLVATDVYGNSQTQTLTITKDTLAPSVIDASRISVTQSGSQVTVAGSSGSAEAGASVNIIANGQTFTTTADANGLFSISFSASTGDQLQISVSDNASNSSSTLGYTVGSSLQFLTPQNSSTLNSQTGNVIGVFAGSNNSGINVNGVTACTYNNNFYINNLPLTAGANTLTATYTTENGSTQSTAINVSSSASASYKFSADQNCGVAPLNVNFNLDIGSNVVQQLDIDYDNDGSIDLSTTTPSTAVLQYNYTTAGVYPVTVWVTTAAGVQQLSLNIVVQDGLQLDSMFKVIWSNMFNALMAGDKTTAIQYITAEGVRNYGGVFDSLMPNMAAIYGELSVIERISAGNEIADYAILRVDNGVIQTFVINFVKGSDGVWRIDSM